MLDWNDLQYFVAVAEHGSTLRAAQALHVSQTTVARRIAALEAALALHLFERRTAGYQLTEDGTALLGQAREVGASAARFTDAAAARTRDVGGIVKLTTEEIFAVTLLGPLLRALHELHPDIVIELDTTQELRDLAGGGADIALRSTIKPQGGGVVGRRLCDDDWTLYCSKDYAAQHGVPRSIAELKTHALVGGGGGYLWRAYSAWLHEFGLEERVAMHHASSSGLLAAVRSGFGIAVLPCIVADAEPDFIRCIPPREKHGRSLWLLTHEQVRHTPRVRTAIDFLHDRLSRHIRGLDASA